MIRSEIKKESAPTAQNTRYGFFLNDAHAYEKIDAQLTVMTTRYSMQRKYIEKSFLCAHITVK